MSPETVITCSGPNVKEISLETLHEIKDMPTVVKARIGRSRIKHNPYIFIDTQADDPKELDSSVRAISKKILEANPEVNVCIIDFNDKNNHKSP